jgi:predicted ferric reductase
MLRGEVFSKINAYAGITGFILLLVFEVGVSFLWGLTDGAMLLAMVGGLLSMAWYVMLALRLFRLERTRRRRDAL